MARQKALMARSHRRWSGWDGAPRASSSDAQIAAAGCHEGRGLVLGVSPSPPRRGLRGRRRAAATGEGEEAVELRSCKNGRGGRNDLDVVPTAAPHRVSPAGKPRVRDEYGTGWPAMARKQTRSAKPQVRARGASVQGRQCLRSRWLAGCWPECSRVADARPKWWCAGSATGVSAIADERAARRCARRRSETADRAISAAGRADRRTQGARRSIASGSGKKR